MNEETFLDSLLDDPGDEVTWSALADWLDDDGQAQRAELLRLTRRLRTLSLDARRDVPTRDVAFRPLPRTPPRRTPWRLPTARR